MSISWVTDKRLSVSSQIDLVQGDDLPLFGGWLCPYSVASVLGLSTTRVVIAVVASTATASVLRLILLNDSGEQLASTDLPWIGAISSALLYGYLMPTVHLTVVDGTHLLEMGAETGTPGSSMVVRRIAVNDSGFVVDYEVSSTIPANVIVANGYSYWAKPVMVVTDLGLVLAYSRDPDNVAPSAIMAVNAATGVPAWVSAEMFLGRAELLVGSSTLTMYDGSSQSWVLTLSGATAVGPAVLDPGYGRHINPFYTAGVSASVDANGDSIATQMGTVHIETPSIVSGLIGVSGCSAWDAALLYAVRE